MLAHRRVFKAARPHGSLGPTLLRVTLPAAPPLMCNRIPLLLGTEAVIIVAALLWMNCFGRNGCTCYRGVVRDPDRASAPHTIPMRAQPELSFFEQAIITVGIQGRQAREKSRYLHISVMGSLVRRSVAMIFKKNRLVRDH